MIANVKFKITMRIRARFDGIVTQQADPASWQGYVDELPVTCGHRRDWRCLLATIMSRELPGCVIRVGQFMVETDLPLLYKGSERSVNVMIPPHVRRILLAQSTPEGMQERKFMSCATSDLVQPNQRKHARKARKST